MPLGLDGPEVVDPLDGFQHLEGQIKVGRS